MILNCFCSFDKFFAGSEILVAGRLGNGEEDFGKTIIVLTSFHYNSLLLAHDNKSVLEVLL